MEALATLAVACNVLQLVDQGIKIGTTCYEMAKTGSTPEITTLEALTKLVADASAAPQPFSSSATDRDLEECAQRCATAAAELSKAVHDIRYQEGTLAERSKPMRLLKAYRNMSKIKQQKDIFFDIQMLLQTKYLQAIRLDIESTNTEETKQLLLMNADIQKLLRGAETDRTAAGDALAAITAIKAQLTSVSGDIKHETQTIVNKLDAEKLETDRRGAITRLAEALMFEGMHERDNEIKARVYKYGETAKWIFGDIEGPNTDDAEAEDIEVDDLERDQDMKDPRNIISFRFRKWLRQTGGIWFVEGKPGSGKSSLMRYIRDNLKVDGKAHHLLTDWAHGSRCAVLSFFFYRPSRTRLANSYEGLWRSLCVQLLANDESLQEKVIKDPTAPQDLKHVFSSKGTAPKAWLVDQLETWCFYLLSATKLHILILLDGLDELREDEDGAQFLAAGRLPDSETALLLALSRIGVMGLWGGPLIPADMDGTDWEISPSFGDCIDVALTHAPQSEECWRALDSHIKMLLKLVPFNQPDSSVSPCPRLAGENPVCCGLPLRLRLLMSLAGNHQSIVSKFVIPEITDLNEQSRPLGAAHAFVRYWLRLDESWPQGRLPMHEWHTLLCMSSPFTELPL